MSIAIEEKKSEGMCTISIFDPGMSGRIPMIILVHNFAGSKENMIEYGYEFAKEGFFAVTFDLYNHRDLSASDKKKEFDFFNLPPDETLKILTESTSFINRVIEIYQSNQKIMSNKIGLVGFSFGGCVVYNYLAGNRIPGIKSAVSILGSPNIINFINKLFVQSGRHMYLGENELEILSEIQPSHNMHELKDFPLLMINNMDDEIVPIQDIRKSHEELFFNYTNQDLLRLIEFRAGGHRIKPVMMDEVILWFKKFLNAH